MTFIERIDFLRKLAEAEQNGKAVEYRFTSGWDISTSTVAESASSVLTYTERYRIAPEPVTRPWRLDEVPIGKIIRYKDGSGYAGRWMIQGVNESYIYAGNDAYFAPEHFFNNATMDDGSPCGVTVTEGAQ